MHQVDGALLRRRVTPSVRPTAKSDTSRRTQLTIIVAMTNTPVTGSVPSPDDPENHEAQLKRALNDAIDAKVAQDDQELEDMADGK